MAAEEPWAKGMEENHENSSKNGPRYITRLDDWPVPASKTGVGNPLNDGVECALSAPGSGQAVLQEHIDSLNEFDRRIIVK